MERDPHAAVQARRGAVLGLTVVHLHAAGVPVELLSVQARLTL